MILPILAYGDPILKKESEEIDETYTDLETLIEDMFETMYRAKGVGLAAPQIGRNIRLFIVDGSPFAEKEEGEDDDPRALGIENFKKVFINPIIEEEEEKNGRFRRVVCPFQKFVKMSPVNQISSYLTMMRIGSLKKSVIVVMQPELFSMNTIILKAFYLLII